MNDLDAFRDNPQAAVAFVTTEHFILQTARSSTTAETNGRASLFLGSVSAGLVALAFAGQTSRAALYTFGLALFPVLCFLGLTTFHRTLQASIDDTIFSQRINRLRRFYLEAAPMLAGYLAQPAATEGVEDVLRHEGFRPGRWQLMVSIPGAISVINAALFGVTVGLAAGAISGDNLWVATIAALVVFAVAIPAQVRYQHRVRVEATRDPFAESVAAPQQRDAERP
jgi:hypothetical protein